MTVSNSGTTNPSELDLLRQRITELEAENAELRKENTVIPDLRIKLSVSDSELAVIKRMNKEFLRANREHDERRDAKVKKLEQKNAELEARLAIVERGSLAEDGQSPEVSAVDDSVVQLKHPKTYSEINGAIPEMNIKANVPANSKSPEESEMDKFLDEARKKSAGDEIRRRNKEKKLQRESADQDNTSDTVYVTETVNNVEKSYEPEINNCTSSHGVEVVVDISKEQTQKSIANSSTLSRDIKPVNKVNRFSENSKLSHEKETVTITSPTFCPEVETKLDTERPENEEGVMISLKTPPSESSNSLPSTKNDRAFSNIATEFIQNLLQELFSPDSQLQAIKFTPPRTLIPRSISIKRLANSFCQANVARGKTISAKQAEITAWCLFSEKFEDKVVELRSNDKKLTDQTARKQIYDEMKPYFSGVSDGYLRVNDL